MTYQKREEMSPKVKLVQTCFACPEQYDGYIDGECVAYLRLRHGHFSAEYRGETVYTASPNGDGIFEYEERDMYLSRACQAIIEAHERTQQFIDNFEIVDKISDPDEEFNDD